MSIADEVKARLDIVDVVSETVALRKSGRNYIGFCPFHQNTRTPSFVVFPDTQTWRCFGACADGGDLFSFVMKREGYDFKEALQVLAKQAGIELKDGRDARSAGQDELRKKLFQVNAAAAAYFHELLTRSPSAEYARIYLSERGIAPETIATFQLGYALDEWEALKNRFVQRGYSTDDLLAAGLLVERDDGTPGYDRFRNRLMIPIRDTRGRVIGFGARALADDQVPKYLNSPQTPIFDKSSVLYGLDMARKAIRQTDEAVIVEGYMDVIQAHQQGAANVVAQMGTSLTEPQLKRLAPLARKIVLALDSDTAGNAATIRSLSVARQALPHKPEPTVTSRGTIAYESHITQEIYIAVLPAGKDPDDVLRQGLAVWQNLIAQAIPSLDFYESLILNQVDIATPQGKSFVVRELIPIYRDIKDNIEKTARVQRLARKIGLDERLLLAELKGGAARPVRPKRRRKAVVDSPQPSPPVEKLAAVGPEAESKLGLEEYCLSLIIASPTTLAAANEVLEQQELVEITFRDFKRSDNREIFKALQLWTALESPTIEALQKMVDPLLKSKITELFNQWHRNPPTPSENLEKELSNAILRLRRQLVQEKIVELQNLQLEARDNGDTESVRVYTNLAQQQTLLCERIDKTLDALSLTGKRRAEARLFG